MRRASKTDIEMNSILPSNEVQNVRRVRGGEKIDLDFNRQRGSNEETRPISLNEILYSRSPKLEDLTFPTQKSASATPSMKLLTTALPTTSNTIGVGDRVETTTQEFNVIRPGNYERKNVKKRNNVLTCALINRVVAN